MNKIFLDMDDVVADYSKKLYQILGYKKQDNVYLDYEWKIILENQRIYKHLEPCIGSEKIVYTAEKISNIQKKELCFLTAVPHKNDFPWAFYDKLNWANKYFPNIPVWFGPYSSDKQKHCSPGDILVDDRKSNIDAWISVGGIGILHTSIEETIYQLESLL